jgi:hypothetical protein
MFIGRKRIVGVRSHVSVSVALVAALATLSGCQCNSHEPAAASSPAVATGGEDAPQVAAPAQAPMSRDQEGSPAVRPRMGGGQPIMPISKGFAQPEERMTVFVTLDNASSTANLAFVNPVLKVQSDSKYEFAKVGKIEYWGNEYEPSKGMTIPAGAKSFSFDIIINKEIEAQPPDVLSYVFEVTVLGTSVKSYFGVIVDLPAP